MKKLAHSPPSISFVSLSHFLKFQLSSKGWPQRTAAFPSFSIKVIITLHFSYMGHRTRTRTPAGLLHHTLWGATFPIARCKALKHRQPRLQFDFIICDLKSSLSAQQPETHYYFSAWSYLLSSKNNPEHWSCFKNPSVGVDRPADSSAQKQLRLWHY